MNKLFSDYNYSGYQSEIIRPITYSDLDLSLRVSPNRKDLTPLTDIDAIKTAVRNLCLTTIYERPFQPDVGTRLNRILFENVNSFSSVIIEKEIENVIKKYEPRVAFVKVDVNAMPDENRYGISITFSTANFPETTVEFIINRLR